MTGLHSMNEFSDIILSCFLAADVRSIVEVGAEYGGTTQRLAAYAAIKGGTLTSIDPSPKLEFLDWVARSPVVNHVAEPSLVAMPRLKDVDAWVIDGDHNYYTVANELLIADALSQRDGKPLFAMLHDVSWPCARRDFYYAPHRIPDQWLLPHSFAHGVTPDNPGAVEGRGLRGEGQFAVALQEGGPRNGVLTAVEDFLKDAQSRGRPLAYASIPAVFGMGIIFDLSAPWAEQVGALLLPWHDNTLLATLERNRLANYLAVIDWQDRERERLDAEEAESLHRAAA